ncbi:hypothetical protein E3Q23_03336 [Wallemia mellicola]|nr:hypothetical protein E3Q23_03336 [Wallemia mellicola]
MSTELANQEEPKPAKADIEQQAELTGVERQENQEKQEEEDKRPLRPLHTLRWPEEPDEKLFQDALSRNDPKPLRRNEIFAIATNEKIRDLFKTYPNLKNLLKELDKIEIDGSRNREVILRRVLGYDENSLSGKSIHGLPGNLNNVQEEDREALQYLMELMNESIDDSNKLAL